VLGAESTSNATRASALASVKNKFVLPSVKSPLVIVPHSPAVPEEFTLNTLPGRPNPSGTCVTPLLFNAIELFPF
jgi:hypothetical protein